MPVLATAPCLPEKLPLGPKVEAGEEQIITKTQGLWLAVFLHTADHSLKYWSLFNNPKKSLPRGTSVQLTEDKKGLHSQATLNSPAEATHPPLTRFHDWTNVAQGTLTFTDKTCKHWLLSNSHTGCYACQIWMEICKINRWTYKLFFRKKIICRCKCELRLDRHGLCK